MCSCMSACLFPTSVTLCFTFYRINCRIFLFYRVYVCYVHFKIINQIHLTF